LHSTLNYLFEWVAHTELEIHWLRTLEMYQRREAGLSAAAKRALPPLLRVWDTDRRTYRSFGVAVTKNEPDPVTWEIFTARLARDIGEDLQRRWQDYLQTEAALDEAAAALGTSVTHVRLREIIDQFRIDILRLVDWMKDMGRPVELPVLDPNLESFAKGAFKLEVLREVPKDNHARERLALQAREELEAWEREQRDLFDD
jgi:hypothetical protein